MASCLLHQNADASISIIDIPSSIEIAQGLSTTSRRLLSSDPLTKPHPSVEPKTEKARERIGEVSLNDLLLCKHLEFALDEAKVEYQGEWCLPRAVADRPAETPLNCKKRKNGDSDHKNGPEDESNSALQNAVQLQKNADGQLFFRNSKEEYLSFRIDSDETGGKIPSKSTLLCGEIASTRDTFMSFAPQFDLIILDPPWPNRSARRKKSYGISSGSSEIQKLLSTIPIQENLAADGTVGIWITNKEAFRDILLQPNGIFDEWEVRLVEEWIWLKTTVKGEPVCALDSVWRKPYEILLIGKRGAPQSKDIKRRVLIGVPDLHSRKPNLKGLFEHMIQKEEYEALEIFARNMTAGWWAWGNEVLKFQMDSYWIEPRSY
ncbi:hypothetical protein EG329_010994 [Mollisiaceae sp. DMI_Dod_QoI]|nr:hypothetical protein EG329_010994 [Helotiales sp. DMI_Dod_QoI]